MNTVADLPLSSRSLYPTSGPSSIADGAATAANVPNGATILIRTLLDLGVDTVFGYPGGAVLPLYDALHGEPRLRHVLVRHEQAAVHAAQGYARSTGKVGVVFVTSGPGMSNTTTGLLDAMCDSVPILCISGQVSTAVIGTDAFQECDALGISRTVTKWNTQLRDAAAVEATVRHAYTTACSGRPGPVLIDFPKDIQLAAVTASALFITEAHGRQAVPRTQQEPPVPHTPALQAPQPDSVVTATHATESGTSEAAAAAMAAAVQAICDARRPVFYGGGGLINSGRAACALFHQLVDATGAPCTLTLMGLGAFPASNHQWLGMLGMHGTLEANLAMHHADLVICIGARFDDRVTSRLSDFCPNAKFLHVDIDSRSIHKIVKADYPLLGDCAAMLTGLLDGVQQYKPDAARLLDWWQQIDGWRAQQSLAFDDTPDAIAPQALVSRLNAQLKGKDAIVSTDVGQHQMWAAQYIEFDEPMRWLTSGGAGTMGYGLPAAIGAQVAYPDKTVVCVSGDASILMNIQELSTAMQHRTPVKVILSNNGYMGMVRQWQELIHGGRYSHSYTEALPDFVAVARGFGWQGRSVSHRDELDDALAECLASAGPYFLDVHVRAEENCFPMIPAGAGHQEIILASRDSAKKTSQD